ncbi:hypothetical protein SESBI_42625 [Sesbania bispinosa]|nr:hypothetical protein SESBI_42625 [Sesbania bispinosa]
MIESGPQLNINEERGENVVVQEKKGREGNGETINYRDRYPQCKGEKVVQEKKVLEVIVEKGMTHGQMIAFPCEADEARGKPSTVGVGVAVGGEGGIGNDGSVAKEDGTGADAVDEEMVATGVEQGEIASGAVRSDGTPGRKGLRVKSPTRRSQHNLKSPAKSPVEGASESGGSKRVLRFKSPAKNGPGHKSPVAKGQPSKKSPTKKAQDVVNAQKGKETSAGTHSGSTSEGCELRSGKQVKRPAVATQNEEVSEVCELRSGKQVPRPTNVTQGVEAGELSNNSGRRVSF